MSTKKPDEKKQEKGRFSIEIELQLKKSKSMKCSLNG